MVIGCDDCLELEREFGVRDAERRLLQRIARLAKAGDVPIRRRRTSKGPPRARPAKKKDTEDSASDDRDSSTGNDEVGSSTDSDYHAAAGVAAPGAPGAPDAGPAVGGPPAPPRPVLDATTGRVHIRNAEGGWDWLGRIVLARIGTPQEAVTVYCRRHQCSVMKRCIHAPPQDRILDWFAAGLDIPQGANKGNQARHKGLWPA